MDNYGFLAKFKRQHWPIDECALEREENRTSSRTLGIHDTAAAFMVPCIGISLASAAFLVELLLPKILRHVYPRNG